MTLISEGITALALLFGSYTDLKTRAVKDKVFVYAAVPILLITAVQVSPHHAAQMFGQGLVFGFIGLLFRFVSKFGMADVLSLALSGMSFPELLSFRPLAYIVGIMWLYMKLYSFLFNSREVPAVPGIFLGFIVAAFLF